MRYVFVLLLAALLSICHAQKATSGRMTDGQRHYREGFADGVAAGKLHGQGLWSTLGCMSGVGGSVGGCYTCAILASCWFEESCIDFSEESFTWIVGISGCLGGLTTGGVLYIIASGSADAPAVLIGKNPEYVSGYTKGYQYITRKSKQKAVLTGTVVGTAIGTMWLMLLTAPAYW